MSQEDHDDVLDALRGIRSTMEGLREVVQEALNETRILRAGVFDHETRIRALERKVLDQ